VVSYFVISVLFTLITWSVSWYQLKLIYPIYEFKTFEDSKIFAALYVGYVTLATPYSILKMGAIEMLPIVLMSNLPGYFTHLKQMIVASDLRDKQQMREIIELHRALKT
jgi:hypothetical protein